MSYSTGHICGLDPVLLWLWCWLAAAVPIPPLPWELLYGTPEALKNKQKANTGCIHFALNIRMTKLFF